jgi:threonine/homoserine/homoserine lactone efflux protein
MELQLSLPLAIGRLSPILIVAVIPMLFSKMADEPRILLAGFVLGSQCHVIHADPAQQATGGEDSPLSAIVHIVLGLLLLFAAYRNWKKRPAPEEQVAMPKWMSSIDSMTAGKALGLGALLSGVNPKNLALTLAAGVVIAAAELNSTQTIIALIIFTIIACISVAAPVIVYLVMGDKATPMLNGWKAWLTHNNTTVMMLLCLVFGIVVLAKVCIDYSDCELNVADERTAIPGCQCRKKT